MPAKPKAARRAPVISIPQPTLAVQIQNMSEVLHQVVKTLSQPPLPRDAIMAGIAEILRAAPGDEQLSHIRVIFDKSDAGTLTEFTYSRGRS